MTEFTGAVKDISLARPALKENRQGEETFALFLGAHQRGRRHFGDVEFTLHKAVVNLPRGILVADIFEIIALDWDEPFDECPITRIGIGAEGYLGLSGHVSLQIVILREPKLDRSKSAQSISQISTHRYSDTPSLQSSS